MRHLRHVFVVPADVRILIPLSFLLPFVSARVGQGLSLLGQFISGQSDEDRRHVNFGSSVGEHVRDCSFLTVLCFPTTDIDWNEQGAARVGLGKGGASASDKFAHTRTQVAAAADDDDDGDDGGDVDGNHADDDDDDDDDAGDDDYDHDDDEDADDAAADDDAADDDDAAVAAAAADDDAEHLDDYDDDDDDDDAIADHLLFVV